MASVSRWREMFSTTPRLSKSTTPEPEHDWSRLDTMTAEERHVAAMSDPDAQPLTPADVARMKRTPQVKVIRRALGLSQEEFATRFHIPLGALRDWEQGRSTRWDLYRSSVVFVV